MRGLLLVAALTTGCSGCAEGDPTPIPGQDEAVRIIWKDTYSEARTPPQIFWRRDSCSEPNGIYGIKPYCTFMDGDARVAGIERDGYIEVGAPSPGFAIFDTSIAHELLHASIGDAEHRSPRWSLVDVATARVKSAAR